MRSDQKWAWLPAVAVAVVLGAIFALYAVMDDGEDAPAPPAREFQTVDPPGPAPPVAVDEDNERQQDEVDESEESNPEEPDPPVEETVDLHEDGRDETPPGVSPAEVAEGREQTEELANEQLGEPQAPAGAQAYSCPQRLVQNRSSLSGPRVGTALHFTVSNPGSINAIRGLFNTPSFGASSNYGIELTGECQQWVPKSEKAWAQGAANSAYFSIEIVTMDRSKESWLASPLIRNGILAALVRDLNRSVGAPLRRVDPVGCAWTPGVVDHDALECGNTHWDVGTHFPWHTFMKQVRQGVKVPITNRHRATCHKIHDYRAGDRRDKKNQAKRLAYVRRADLKCVNGKPRRK